MQIIFVIMEPKGCSGCRWKTPSIIKSNIFLQEIYWTFDIEDIFVIPKLKFWTQKSIKGVFSYCFSSMGIGGNFIFLPSNLVRCMYMIKLDSHLSNKPRWNNITVKVYIKPRSHRACDRTATSQRLKNDNCRSSGKVLQRSQQGRRSKSVASRLLSMHERLAPTDFDHRLFATFF